MRSTTGHKRRRIDTDDAVAFEMVERDATDIRKSLKTLHEDLPRLGDITVSVQGPSETRDFHCISALLASASRPLHAMLFGPMADASGGLDKPREKRCLRLTATEPWCFEMMLNFIHGQKISLTVDTAVQIHHVADYYEVLPLRDSCCRFLLDALRPHNCCGLLMRSYDINCEVLTQRCLDTLTLDFVSVVEADAGFPELDAAVLRSLIAHDSLVCAEEAEVFDALLKWYAAKPAERHALLVEMLPEVRWAFIGEEKRPALLDALRAAAADVPTGGLVGSGGGDGGEDDEVQYRSFAGYDTQESSQGGEASAAAELEECVERYLAQQPPAEEGEAEQRAACRPRNYTWGTLVGRNPEPPAQPQLTPDMQKWRLESTKEYMIGRSRKSTIRIGHNAPMPYISSQHFRVYNQIRWPDAPGASGSSGSSGGSGGGGGSGSGGGGGGGSSGGGGGGGGGGAASSSSSSSQASPHDVRQPPRLEAWLEDLSQNGTFVNGLLVGRNEKRKLEDGDRIELVFPQDSAPRSPNNVNHFPIFTYQAPARGESAAAASQESRAEEPPRSGRPSPDGGASQSSSQD